MAEREMKKILTHFWVTTLGALSGRIFADIITNAYLKSAVWVIAFVFKNTTGLEGKRVLSSFC